MNKASRLLLVAVALTLSSPAFAEEWIALFDGTSLDGFHTLGEAEWNIIDGYVEADGYTGSYLVTNEDYGDFELELEFWPGLQSNSGVYIRNSSSEKISADAGYEINIFDTNENPDNRTGAIIFFSAPLVATATEEKWNRYAIRAEGSRVVVHLNGVLVADLEDQTYASGPIAFQNNGGLIRFRNIRVRPIDAQ